MGLILNNIGDIWDMYIKDLRKDERLFSSHVELENFIQWHEDADHGHVEYDPILWRCEWTVYDSLTELADAYRDHPDIADLFTSGEPVSDQAVLDAVQDITVVIDNEYSKWDSARENVIEVTTYTVRDI